MAELHLYPGQHVLAVVDDGKVTKRFEAYGGPDHRIESPTMAEIPTTEGTYIIHHVEAYSTPSWGWSRIKWGTPLKDMWPKERDVWYQLPNGKWGSLYKDFKFTRADVINRYDSLYFKAEVPKTWVFNDFGPVAVRFFKDLNGNKILDSKESLSGQMIHTTPDNEAAVANGDIVRLAQSHGCIHIKPQDRDILRGMGLFKNGTAFIVHSYKEKLK